MAGQLTISTLSDGVNSTSATNCIQGSAKAWVRFSYSGGTLTVNKSFNVSSVTRTAIGNYTVTMTNAMADANYSMATNGTYTSTTGSAYNNYNVWTIGIPSTTTVCYVYFVSGAFYDVATASCVIFD
jgi:hypothetical protein